MHDKNKQSVLKKLLTVMAVVCLAAGLSACGNSSDTAVSSKPSVNSESAKPAE
ncbi:hypothetical protein GCM10008018_17090 [Paenibacillus marchantiophytorum]|uniref:ABC transporter substrate-binding protein n=1 Tax=Paenibacillus marchantiophytorum TaxID=1619310 RepID=A0ABQ2BU68_9BACL|nr:hypothetical protein [Paenibacillus marchantiophytorum]GGI46437.1 hypothetical protein GCM10008018_17090 [Paenibacillus marchantiophytorum]